MRTFLFGSLGKDRCLPSTIVSSLKRQSDDFIIPPYYNPSEQLYPYGISKPALPFYKGQELSSSSNGKKLGNHDDRWDSQRRLSRCSLVAVTIVVVVVIVVVFFFFFRMGSLSFS
jgi:hypothetical protein